MQTVDSDQPAIGGQSRGKKSYKDTKQGEEGGVCGEGNSVRNIGRKSVKKKEKKGEDQSFAREGGTQIKENTRGGARNKGSILGEVRFANKRKAKGVWGCLEGSRECGST